MLGTLRATLVERRSVPDDQHKANPVRAAEIFRNADLTALADKIGEQLAAATLPEREEAHDAKLQVEEFIDQIQEYFTDGYGWAIDENTGEKVVLITKAQRGEVKAAMKGLRDAMHPPPANPFRSIFNPEGQAARQDAAPQRTNSHDAEMVGCRPVVLLTGNRTHHHHHHHHTPAPCARQWGRRTSLPLNVGGNLKASADSHTWGTHCVCRHPHQRESTRS